MPGIPGSKRTGPVRSWGWGEEQGGMLFTGPPEMQSWYTRGDSRKIALTGRIAPLAPTASCASVGSGKGQVNTDLGLYRGVWH